ELAGYEKPTPIQARVIPHLLEGRDIVAQSETGSGKTAAFALPILTRLDMQKREPQVLVLTPTRELAIQVAKSFSTYGDALPRFSVAAIYGGQDYEIQLRQLRRGVQVIVGTPGRVIDHVHRGTLDLSKLDCLVLDEADEMLNMGFMEDVEFVLDQTPDHRQIALFSATMPGPIRDIAEESLNDPAKVTVKQKGATAESITQRAYFVPPREKIELLRRLLEVEDTDGVIVFTKTKESTLSVAEQLVRSGLRAVALNGDMPQSVRERAINQLKSGKLDILVATDVAARGLDVSRISHVVNFDLPHDSESYVHRVGRTGRAGREGTAFLFLTNAQRGKLRTIERATRQKIELAEMPTADAVNAKRIERFKNSITETTAEQDLTFFKELIAEYAEESGKPMDMIAAALAMIGTGGRNFLLKDRPKPKRSERSFDRDRDGGRPGGQRQRRDYERDDRRGALRPLEPGMNRYRVAVGRRDGVRPGNLVGAVANEAGIEGEYIGQIRIFDSYTMIDLPEGMPNDVYDTLQRTRVAGKPLRLKLADDDRGERRGPPHRKTHHKKPKHRKHKR
ncbi:MAG: DEAD/DEAH box helicase, partial [Planctomycetota bacterium]